MGVSEKTSGQGARKCVADLATAVAVPQEALPFMQWGQDDILSCRAVAVLLTIRANPGMSTGPIAAALGLRKPAVTRAVDRLAEMGLVKRAIEPSDRRMVRLMPINAKKGKR